MLLCLLLGWDHFLVEENVVGFGYQPPNLLLIGLINHKL
jgi:hypothetical protein